MTDTVALIGVGAMGKALLSRLQVAKKNVRAFDIAEAGREAARAGGAEVVGSAAEAARGAAYIHLFVRTDEEEIEATLGPKGVLAEASAGALLILHPTVLPAKIGRAHV